MIVTFTLQSLYSDPLYVAGPFNISGTTSGNATTELASGLTKDDLLTGYTINGVDDLTTGGTIASTGVCTNTQPWTTGIAPAPTATPTVTPSAYGYCYSLTYSSIPSTLYVRYMNMEEVVTTELIQSLQTIDNGNGTYTAYICVKQGGSYATPTCVEFNNEFNCSPYAWLTNGCSCTDLNGSSCSVPCA